MLASEPGSGPGEGFGNGSREGPGEAPFRLRLEGVAVWVDVAALPVMPLDVLRALRTVAPEAQVQMGEVFQAVASVGAHRIGTLGLEGPPTAPWVTVEEAELVCRLFLPPRHPEGGGGETVRERSGRIAAIREEILELLAREGISYGLDEGALFQAAAQSAGGDAVSGAVVARGTSPVPGEDGRVESFFSRPTGRPLEDAAGNVDHYALDLIVPVDPGVVVARRHPPTAGRAGRTVRGQEIPPRRGRPALLSFGRGLRLRENGELVTEYGGALNWKGSKILLERLLTVPGDVDFSTGNVAFDGPVLVRGSVRDGFSVEAGGDVDIQGSVERATVVSRTGRVAVRYGVHGRGQGVIRAASEVRVRFLQETLVECDTLVVNEYILRSTVRARKGVLVEGRRGIITASEIQALAHVHAKDVRSLRDGDTRIEIPGVPRGELFKEYQTLEGDIERGRDMLSALSAEVRAAAGKGSPRLRELLLRYLELADTVAEKEARYEELQALLRKLRGDATFSLRGECSPGVRLRIKDHGDLLRDAVSHITIFYDPDEHRIVALGHGGR